ncbi:NAD(+) diphosphatase [Marinobacter sp. M216]|uniref:NAD(+) diphosphatase n=1 Tax=Marinobacter albus TaxID=3030833 RepID=A0ABT7HIA2_9GAMM|nr:MULTISPECIES: NAD(+) diphosphatase [unclassified Marinobacter]MBW7472728.1 NAD(+) diphosphatase [Marinobacter sp. F4218]MDK9559281.1 NAD(+) diphosphatase [Marinobacter sp. M216]
MAISNTDWTPGWTTNPPQAGDRLLAISGSAILKPEEGWFLLWGSDVHQGIDCEPVSLGIVDGKPVYVTELPDPVRGGLEPVPLRDALLMMEEAPAELLSTGFQVWQWWRDHRYCGRCGQETEFHPHERAKWCGPCGIPWYPRLAPCVIVVIRRDDRLLLARSSRARHHFYSLIAGFVEPGESLEEAVVREVKEETGLDVTNVRYQSSQPWPFPHQLMVGFFADYAGGDLVLQEDELADADWFVPGDTPPVPPQTTIAGRLIRAMESAISPRGSAS